MLLAAFFLSGFCSPTINKSSTQAYVVRDAVVRIRTRRIQTNPIYLQRLRLPVFPIFRKERLVRRL